MKRIKLFCVVILFVIGISTPIVTNAESLLLNESEETYFDNDGNTDDEYRINLSDSAKYKIVMKFIGYEMRDDTEYERPDLTDYSIEMFIANKYQEKSFFIPVGESKSFIVGLDSGKTDIGFMIDDDIEDYSINGFVYEITVKKIKAKKVSYSKANKFVKKNLKSYMHYSGNKKKASVVIDGVSGTDSHEEDGYVMGCNMFPYINLKKQKNSSVSTYYISGLFLCYSNEQYEDSDLYLLMFGSGKKKISYKLDYSKEKNKFSYKDYYYKDTCNWKCTLFRSYASKTGDIDKLIKIIKGKKSWVRIKGEDGVYYKFYFDSKTKKQWIASLNLYKKLLKKY